MKNFIVKGCNWSARVEIDETIIEKYMDMACEASTRGLELYLDHEYEKLELDEVNGPHALGPFMSSCEEGLEDDDDKVIVILTEHILRNAGKHTLADRVATLVQKHYGESSSL